MLCYYIFFLFVKRQPNPKRIDTKHYLNKRKQTKLNEQNNNNEITLNDLSGKPIILMRENIVMHIAHTVPQRHTLRSIEFGSITTIISIVL